MRDLYIAKYNDVQILEIVNSFRFLPLQVLTKILIEKKLYGSYQAVSRTINRLREHGLIRSTYFTNNAKIIFLSRQGAKQLATGTGVNEDSINCPERLTGVNFFALEHTIKVAELYLLLLRECEKHNISLKSFTGDHFTRYEYKFRDYSSGRDIRRYVLPDAEVDLTIDNHTYRIWIEYDRGTEASKEVAVKYMKYFEYYCEVIEEQKWYPIILFITESTKERLNNLVVKDKNYNGEWDYYQTNKSYKNVVLKGISQTPNLKSLSSQEVESFLMTNRFLFIDYVTFENDGFNTDLLNFKAEPIKLLDILKSK